MTEAREAFSIMLFHLSWGHSLNHPPPPVDKPLAERERLYLGELQDSISLSVSQTSLWDEPIHLLASAQDSLCPPGGKTASSMAPGTYRVNTQRVLGELDWGEPTPLNVPTLVPSQ